MCDGQYEGQDQGMGMSGPVVLSGPFLILICRAFLSLALQDISIDNTHKHRNTTKGLKIKAKATHTRDENLKSKTNIKLLYFCLEFCIGFSLSFK